MGDDTDLPELPLASGTRIIGDLHLDVSGRGEAAPLAGFERWLAELRGVPRLVILGDLFDAWIGPAHLNVSAAGTVVDAIAALVARGPPWTSSRATAIFCSSSASSGPAAHAFAPRAAWAWGPRGPACC